MIPHLIFYQLMLLLTFRTPLEAIDRFSQEHF